MPITESQTSSAAIESAVSETMRQMSASALDLLARRAEINGRIRRLQQVMRGLRDLAVRSAFNEHDPRSVDLLASETPEQRIGALGGVIDLSPPGGSTNTMAGLTRACRIALMEAAAFASLEEIHARIVRRGSFSFADSESPHEAIGRALNAMADLGELRRLEKGNHRLWQRIASAREIDNQQPLG
jgi:hypothetical protein